MLPESFVDEIFNIPPTCKLLDTPTPPKITTLPVKFDVESSVPLKTAAPVTINPLNVPTLVICGCAAFTLNGIPDPPDKPVPAIPLATRIPPPKISILVVSTTTERALPVFDKPLPDTTTSPST